MIYAPRGLMKRLSGGFLISVSLLSTDLECLIRNLIFKATPTTFYEISKISHICSIFGKSVCVRVVHIF